MAQPRQEPGPSHITIVEGRNSWQLDWQQSETVAELKQRITKNYSQIPKDRMVLKTWDGFSLGADEDRALLAKGDRVYISYK